MNDAKALRLNIKTIQEVNKGKKEVYTAYIPIRDGLYYGIPVNTKKSVNDVLPELKDKVKWKDK